VFISFAEHEGMSGLSLACSLASLNIGEEGTRCKSWESSLLCHRF
jgi:hypothetical protein